MSPCLLIFGTKEKKNRKMFINLCEPISAVEKSRYSGMQFIYFGYNLWKAQNSAAARSRWLPGWGDFLVLFSSALKNTEDKYYRFEQQCQTQLLNNQLFVWRVKLVVVKALSLFGFNFQLTSLKIPFSSASVKLSSTSFRIFWKYYICLQSKLAWNKRKRKWTHPKGFNSYEALAIFIK